MHKKQDNTELYEFLPRWASCIQIEFVIYSHSKYQRNSVQAEADSRTDRNAILIAERLLGRPIAC